MAKEDHVTGRDGIVASGVICEGRSLKILHVYVRHGAAGGFAHPKSLLLFVEFALPTEIGKVEVEFDQSQDVIYPDWSAFGEIRISLKLVP